MMQQPSHPPHIAAGGAQNISSHPGAVAQYQLAPHPGVAQPTSAASTQETVSAPEPNSPNPSDDPGSKRSRKRKSPADGATEEEEERANRSPPAPAAHHEQPPHPHTTAAPQPTPEQVAAQQQAAAAAHHAQQHHQPPPPPPHHQLPPLGHPQHPQGQHMHPSFHFHPHQVPPGYVPVMPVPMGAPGVPGAPQNASQSDTPQDHHSPGSTGASGGRPLNTSKRAEQNRKAQRAFRERRDAHVKALESRSQLLDAALASVEEANRRWEESRQLCETLRMENAQLRAALQAYQQAGAAITQMQQIAQTQQQMQQQQQPSGQTEASAASTSEATPEKDANAEAQSASS